MDAIYPINNNVLFFIEGLGQQGIASNWGDGLATSQSAIAAAGASDPNAFFTSLMGRPYLNQVLQLTTATAMRVNMMHSWLTSCWLATARHTKFMATC